MLRRAAYSLYAERKRLFTRADFVNSVMNVGGPRPLVVDEAVQFFLDLLRDCLVIPISRDRFGFFHLSVHEYLAAMDLSDDAAPGRVFAAIKEFFRSGGWWEEVLVFYAAEKRDIAPVLEDLHTKSIPAGNSEGVAPAFLRLLGRMIDVADFTDMSRISPKGAVARAFQELNVAGQGQRWHKFAKASSYH